VLYIFVAISSKILFMTLKIYIAKPRVVDRLPKKKAVKKIRIVLGKIRTLNSRDGNG
jgi:hypothetical protein